MTNYDKIYEVAADNYGLITTAQANALGVPNKDLVRFVAEGRLERIGRGVYLIKYWVPTENDPYAQAVALVGDQAYLYGESVIAMYNLAPTNPARITVATPVRVRKQLPKGVKIVNRPTTSTEATTTYEGIPSQTIPDAIRACRTTMMPKRLIAATNRARELGLIKESEKAHLIKELSE